MLEINNEEQYQAALKVRANLEEQYNELISYPTLSGEAPTKNIKVQIKSLDEKISLYEQTQTDWYDTNICIPASSAPVLAIFNGKQYQAMYFAPYWEEFNSEKFKGEPLYFDDDKDAKPEKWKLAKK